MNPQATKWFQWTIDALIEGDDDRLEVSARLMQIDKCHIEEFITSLWRRKECIIDAGTLTETQRSFLVRCVQARL
jgi:hypothetical protein